MSGAEKHSPLEEFLENDSWRQSVQDLRLKRLKKKLWGAVWWLLALCTVNILAFQLIDPVPSSVVGLFVIGYLVIVLLCFIVGGLLGTFIGLVPYKQYDMNDRTSILIPGIMIVIGVLGELILIVVTFSALGLIKL